MTASAASMAVRSQKSDRAYPPPSCSFFQGRRGSRLWMVMTCGIDHMSLAKWPPRLAYQVWLWTRSLPLAFAAMARSMDMACSAAPSGLGSLSPSQGL